MTGDLKQINPVKLLLMDTRPVKVAYNEHYSKAALFTKTASKAHILILATFAAILSTGCASCPPSTEIGTPPRPTLIAVPDELWDRVPLEAQDIWSSNDLALKEYARRLEARISAYDESIE